MTDVGAGRGWDSDAMTTERRWWVTRNRGNGKVLGPFATREEAIENRVKLEEYSGRVTFWVWEFVPEPSELEQAVTS